MAPRPALPARAVLPMPRWLADGNPSQHLKVAGLRSQPVRGAADQYEVQTEESYLQRRRPGLIEVEHLAGPIVPTPRLERLIDAEQTAELRYDVGAAAIAEAEVLREKAQRSRRLVDGVVAWQAATLCVPVERLPELTAAVREGLLALRTAERPGEPVMNSVGVHLVRRSPRLIHRTKLFLLLLQSSHDPRLRGGDSAALQEALDTGERVFAASQDLYQGFLLGEVYLAPLLGALSPAVWAFNVPRALGIIVYTFGQPLQGNAGNAAELLQTLPRQGASPDPAQARASIPTLSPTAASAALDWWTRRLDELFGVLTNPALAADQTGIYIPSKLAHSLLSAEQLFRRVTSIQAAYRDGHARRVLLFTVLDTLERLTGRKIADLGSARFARTRLDKLTTALPSDAAEVLLPGAERAVTALEQLQHGFFVTRQLGRSIVQVPDSNGATRDLSMDRATAEYLKVLRDATHGHGSNKGERVQLTNALLAQHDGRIPHDLGQLGYLYLLDLLAHPDDLAHHIYARGRA